MGFSLLKKYLIVKEKHITHYRHYAQNNAFKRRIHVTTNSIREKYCIKIKLAYLVKSKVTTTIYY